MCKSLIVPHIIIVQPSKRAKCSKITDLDYRLHRHVFVTRITTTFIAVHNESTKVPDAQCEYGTTFVTLMVDVRLRVLFRVTFGMRWSCIIVLDVILVIQQLCRCV